MATTKHTTYTVEVSVKVRENEGYNNTTIVLSDQSRVAHNVTDVSHELAETIGMVELQANRQLQAFEHGLERDLDQDLAS